ncbi:MAG: outer membrane protein transport protein [bacterium]|nr:MAG: outer membrane protein transport protein [bacterium]
MRRGMTVFLILLFMVGFTVAAGYQIGEHGTRAMGMGGAFVAQASDPSAIFFNAAGLGFQTGLNIMAGATIIMPKSDFTGPTPSTTTTDMESQTFYPPHAYVTYALENGVAFGVGFFAPFGLGTKWADDWVGRYLAVQTDLQALYINPTVAYKINEKVSVGVGFSYIMGEVELTQRVPTFSTLLPPTPAANDGWVSLKGDGTGFSFNAGVLYKASEKVSLGLSYRSLSTIKFEGDAVFTDMQALATFFPGGTGKTELPMPADLKAGIAYNVNEKFTVEADFEYVFWNAYKELELDIPDGPNFPLTGAPLQTGSVDEKDYKNAYLVRLGGEYSLEKLALRLGFVYDMSPVPDKSLEPLLPDSDRLEGIIGLGYMFSENVRVDAAYQYIKASERTVTSPTNEFPGTYNSTANLFGLTLGLSF